MSAETFQIEWERGPHSESGRLGKVTLWKICPTLVRDKVRPYELRCFLPGVRPCVRVGSPEAAKDMAQRQIKSFLSWIEASSG